MKVYVCKIDGVVREDTTKKAATQRRSWAVRRGCLVEDLGTIFRNRYRVSSQYGMTPYSETDRLSQARKDSAAAKRLGLLGSIYDVGRMRFVGE